jgi:hypothetical protein
MYLGKDRKGEKEGKFSNFVSGCEVRKRGLSLPKI